MKDLFTKTFAPIRQPPKPRFARSTFPSLASSVGPTAYPDPLSFRAADLAPDPPAPDLPDYLLLASTENLELILTVPWPENADSTDRVQIEVDGDRVDTAYLLSEVDADGNETMLAIPFSAAARNGTREGRHDINYVVTFEGGGNDERGPFGQRYITDYTEPGEPFLAPLEFSDEVIANGVTPETLEIENGVAFLPALIAGYSGLARGDIITGIVNGAEETVDTITVGGGGLELRFLRSFIEAQGDGNLTFEYKVKDRAGNESRNSRPFQLDVLLTGAIPDLAPPIVPAYDDDDDTTDPKVIDEADAREVDGLKVHIPKHDGMEVGDEIYVLWGGATDDPVIGPFTLASVTPDPVAIIGVPYAAISSKWHEDGNDADVAKPVNVHYLVKRGRLTVGRTPVANTVEVNLHVAGGQDPDPETPWNDNLRAPVLTSFGDKENEIPMEDFDQDATIVVPWFQVDPPTTATFVETDVVTVHYGTEVLSHTVDSDDVTNEELPPFTLTAAAIGRVGSGTIELSYTVSRALGSGRPNETDSPPQDVVVRGSDTLPGGGTLLPGSMPEAVGTVPGEPDRLLISKDQARDGADFIIPAYTNQNTGDDITLEMSVYRSFMAASHGPNEVEETQRKVVISGVNPPATGDIAVHLTEVDLMRYDLPTRSLHAHFVYTIRGVADPTVPVTSDPALLVDLDPRGD